MTAQRSSSSIIFAVIGATFGLFVLGQLVGPPISNNNWNLIHWRLLPSWYKIAWAVFAAVFVALSLKYADRLGWFAETRTRAIGSLIVLFILFFIFQFDSIVYAGGNM